MHGMLRHIKKNKIKTDEWSIKENVLKEDLKEESELSCLIRLAPGSWGCDSKCSVAPCF